MTLLFIDSFDHYATADLNMKWNSVTGAGCTIGAGSGRRNTAALRVATTSSAGIVQKSTAAAASHVIGFAYRTNILFNGLDIFRARDGSTIHLSLRLNSTGTISILRGGVGGTVLATTSTTLSINTYYYIEFKYTINDSTGAYELRINGANAASGTGADTRNGGNATVDNFQLGMFTGESGTQDYDDLYLCDTGGSTNNDFLGDVRVDCYLPSGNGNSSQLVGSDGNSTDNYLLVDEASQNGDTDYVQSSTVNNKDTYTFADMAHTPASIFGTQLNMIAKKDDSGTRSICSVCRSGGTDYDGTTQALGTTYTDHTNVREVDPATSSAWTRTNLNNAEFGVKVAA